MRRAGPDRRGEIGETSRFGRKLTKARNHHVANRLRELELEQVLHRGLAGRRPYSFGQRL